jgi:hypothetical protein
VHVRRQHRHDQGRVLDHAIPRVSIVHIELAGLAARMIADASAGQLDIATHDVHFPVVRCRLFEQVIDQYGRGFPGTNNEDSTHGRMDQNEFDAAGDAIA